MLIDFKWLQAKLGATTPTALIADYALIPDDASLQLIKEALQAVRPSPREGRELDVEGQLLGRLADRDDSTIQSLLDVASRSRTGAWLRPLTRSLVPPGSLQRRVILVEDSRRYTVVNAPEGVAISADGHVAVSQIQHYSRSGSEEDLEIYPALLVGIAIAGRASRATIAAPTSEDDH